MKKARFIVAMLLAFSVFTFVGCGGDNNADESMTETTTVEETTDNVVQDMEDDAEDLGEDVKDGAQDMATDVKDGAEDLLDGTDKTEKNSTQ